MKSLSVSVSLVTLLLGLAGTSCGPTSPTGSGGTGGSAGSGGGTPFPPVSDFAATGPFPTTVENNTGPNGAYTLFRPTTLGESGRKHPILTWGNGTFLTPEYYAEVLTHLASHGFVVIAANTTNTGTGAEMRAGIDWLIEQNAASSGTFAGKLDPNRVGTFGHSQGGGGTINAAAHPNVKTLIPIEPLPQTQNLHGSPMLLLCGKEDATVDAETVCRNNVYTPSVVPTFFGIVSPVTHLTPIGAAGPLRQPITAWFRLQLMGDETARNLFYGTSCTYCTDPNWQVSRKNGIQ